MCFNHVKENRIHFLRTDEFGFTGAQGKLYTYRTKRRGPIFLHNHLEKDLDWLKFEFWLLKSQFVFSNVNICDFSFIFNSTAWEYTYIYSYFCLMYILFSYQSTVVVFINVNRI